MSLVLAPSTLPSIFSQAAPFDSTPVMATAMQTRVASFALIFLFLFSSFVYFGWKRPHAAPFLGQPHDAQQHYAAAETSLQDVLKFIFDRNSFNATTPSFNHVGETYTLPAEPIYKSSLGSDILILDVDTRPFDKENQIFHQSGFNWSQLETHSGGVANHYMYGKYATSIVPYSSTWLD